MLFLFSGCTLPKFKMPTFFGLPSNLPSITAPAVIPSSNHSTTSVDKLTAVEAQIRDLRTKVEKDYQTFKNELEQAYKAKEKATNDNINAVSEVNYGIAYVTEKNKNTDVNTMIANLRAKQNMSRLYILSNEAKDRIQNEVEIERQTALDTLVSKYDTLVQQSKNAMAAIEAASKLVDAKESEKQGIIDRYKKSLEALESKKDAEYETLKNDINGKIISAKEDQRLSMIMTIVKPLGIIGVLIFVGGLLLRSATFIVTGLVSMGVAYVAPIIPFWIVTCIIGAIILAMIFVDPKSGKLAFFKFGKTQTNTSISDD